MKKEFSIQLIFKLLACVCIWRSDMCFGRVDPSDRV